MKQLKVSILLFAASLLPVSLYSAEGWAEEGGDFNREIEYRQSLMTLLGWNMKSMGAMMKGKTPFDEGVFARHAQDLAAIASLDLISGFPEDSDQGETDARPDIWLDLEDFEKKFKTLQQTSSALKEAASGADKARLKTAYGEVGKACKACHRAYKD
jgi:cytochrome c556